MKAPVKELEKRKVLIEQGRRLAAEGKWDEAGRVVLETIALDENYPKAYELMADIFAGKDQTKQALEYRERAADIRKRAWQREVEAQVRGQHELLGQPGRHEIP